MMQAKRKRNAERKDGVPSPPSGGPQRGHRLDEGPNGTPEGELMQAVRKENMSKAKRKMVAHFNQQAYE